MSADKQSGNESVLFTKCSVHNIYLFFPKYYKTTNAVTVELFLQKYLFGTSHFLNRKQFKNFKSCKFSIPFNIRQHRIDVFISFVD